MVTKWGKMTFQNLTRNRHLLITYELRHIIQVYERLGWKDIRMSRALRAACGPSQTPRSSTDLEGASLRLDLHENERECKYMASCHHHSM